eukprot:3865791-Amphidinium_carterae.1
MSSVVQIEARCSPRAHTHTSCGRETLESRCQVGTGQASTVIIAGTCFYATSLSLSLSFAIIGTSARSRAVNGRARMNHCRTWRQCVSAKSQ